MGVSIVRLRRGWPMAAMALVALLSLPAGFAPAAALLANWQGADGGGWKTAANWDINQVPNNTAANTFSVRVDAGNQSVSLDTSPTVTNYTQATGSLVGKGALPPLTVTGAMNWNSGKIDQMVVNANGTATIAKLVPAAMNPTLGNAIFYNNGTTTISASPLDGLSGALLINNKTININGASQLNDLSGGVATLPTISNYGTINKTGNGTATIAWLTSTNSMIESQAGELKFTGGLGVNAGKLQVDQGATITSTTPISVNNASVGGAGTVKGTISLNGTIQGAPTPGKLLVVGDLQNSSSDLGSSISTFDSAVGGPGSWPDYNDQVEVDGNVQLPDLLDISVWPGYTPPASYEYDVLVTTGAMTGTFQNALPGQRILSDDGNWSFIVNYGSGDFAQKVALTDFQAVPEPSTLSLLSMGALTLLRRRRGRPCDI
jgi:hypothetical protein